MVRKFRPKEEGGEESELNLVPYLDIMMNLIMFMLFSTTGLTQLTSIDISQPSYTKAKPCPGCPEPEDNIEVTLAISELGYTILLDGVPLEGSQEGVSVRRVGEGVYDFKSLKERMTDLKAAHPEQDNIIITAEDETPYELMVASMDAVRYAEGEEGDKLPLYPYVVMANF